MENVRFIEFDGIDGFNRPVFKRVGNVKPPAGRKFCNYFYGSTEILFDMSATENEVLAKVSEKDLVFFGNKFGCEPCGGEMADDIKIRKWIK